MAVETGYRFVASVWEAMAWELPVLDSPDTLKTNRGVAGMHSMNNVQ